MTKFLCLVFFHCLANFSSVGQFINKKTKINLLDSNQISLSRQVIIMQTDSLIISTTYVIFSNHLKAIAKTNNNLNKDYDSIYTIVKQDTINKIIARLNNLSFNLKESLEYIVGDLLQLGKCFAYNKLMKRRIKQVTIIDYGSYNYGATGKKYYLDKILLLDNTEMVF
jgi:hypothetical protein